MSSTHTPGRLEVHCPESDSPGISTPGNVEGVATTYGIYACRETKQANARRLVACWNACDGVPTDALERSAPMSTVTAEAIAAGRELERRDSSARLQAAIDALAKTETYLLERLAGNPGSTGSTVIIPMIRRAIEGAGVAPTQSSWGDV